MDVSYKEIQSWFQQEVYYWRLTSSVICASFVQAVLFVLVAILLNFNVFEPLVLFQEGILFLLSLIGVGFVLTLITVLLVLSFAANYTLIPFVFSTVVDLFAHLVHPHRLSVVFAFTLVGGCLSFLYLRATGSSYSALTEICERENGEEERSELCLNLNYVLLLLSGCYVGFVYGVGICVNNYDYISFPIIQQNKFVLIKGMMLEKLKKSMKNCLVSFKWFFLLYAMFGFNVQNWLADCLQLRIVFSSWLSMFFSIVDVQFLWTAFVVATAVHFQLTAAAHLFRVFQTERVAFSIDTHFEDESCRTLINALRCVEFPLVRHLGFLDLALISQQSFSKRKEIFSLSQLGGHPHRWNEIAKECLELTRGVTNRIITFCEPPILLKPNPQSSPVFEQRYTSPSRLNSTDIAYELWRSQRSYVTSPVLSPKSQQRTATKSAVGTDLPFPFNLLPLAIASLKRSILQKITEFWNLFNNYPLVEFFLKEYQERGVRKIFAPCQVDIWAIEAVSFLVAASFNEDKYGVVQKDLSDILTSFLDLHQALKRLQKMEIGISRQTSKSNEPSDHLKASLRSTVKLALYRITTTFGGHLTSVSLSSDNRNLLNQFLTFQE